MGFDLRTERPVAASASSSKPRRILSDLVRDSEIEAVDLGTCIQHFRYRAGGRTARKRVVRTEERWVRDATLGSGAFGTVYRERCEGGDNGEGDKVRAVKEIKKLVVEREELDYTRELEAIVKFSHPRYSHCFVSSDGWFELGDSIYISMEYLELGDLQRHLAQPLSEFEARDITSQVLEGLGFMHENGFVHRDLKPGNIMVVSREPEWFVKIADFGISKRRLADTTLFQTSNRFTLGFAAPEQLGLDSTVEGAGAARKSPYAMDLWSLGAVAFRVLSDRIPFMFQDLIRYVGGTAEFPAERLRLRGVSEAGQDFIRAVMAPAAGDRLSASAAMEHVWMGMSLSRPASSSRPALDSGEPQPGTMESAASAAWSSAGNMTVRARQTPTALAPTPAVPTQLKPESKPLESATRRPEPNPEARVLDPPEAANDPRTAETRFRIPPLPFEPAQDQTVRQKPEQLVRHFPQEADVVGIGSAFASQGPETQVRRSDPFDLEAPSYGQKHVQSPRSSHRAFRSDPFDLETPGNWREFVQQSRSSQRGQRPDDTDDDYDDTPSHPSLDWPGRVSDFEEEEKPDERLRRSRPGNMRSQESSQGGNPGSWEPRPPVPAPFNSQPVTTAAPYAKRVVPDKFDQDGTITPRQLHETPGQFERGTPPKSPFRALPPPPTFSEKPQKKKKEGMARRMMNFMSSLRPQRSVDELLSPEVLKSWQTRPQSRAAREDESGPSRREGEYPREVIDLKGVGGGVDDGIRVYPSNGGGGVLDGAHEVPGGYEAGDPRNFRRTVLRPNGTDLRPTGPADKTARRSSFSGSGEPPSPSSFVSRPASPSPRDARPSYDSDVIF